MSGADADAALSVRDTDADWRELGGKNPYWAVLSHSNLLSDNLPPERGDEFYASGPSHIDAIDLSKIVRPLNLAGIEEIRPISTDHDGYHGVIILGRKTAEPISS
ncbi:MAG TPA: hypothetical protein VGH86_13320 [Phenylobacterium sp.]|jgi:hypothetical protein